MNNLSDGDYYLGLMPKNGEEAKLLWAFSIHEKKVSTDDPLSLFVCIEFILRSGQCSIEKVDRTYKYLVLKQ